MKLQAVVVLYKHEIAESKTIRSLCDQVRTSGLQVRLLIYDNSPARQTCEHAIADMIPVAYSHDPANGGLVPAYNQGLRMAQENGAQWLLLLDHDTVLTARYFAELARVLRDYGDDPRIAAFAPHIIVRGRYVAPTWFSMGIHRRMKASWHGRAANPITTINSASVVRISFLEAMGGFDRNYPLDFTDYWLYREIYRRGRLAMVLDCGLVHELSSANRDTFRPVHQYRDVLHHEGMFYRSSGSRIVIFLYWSRLMLRVVKHSIVFKDKGYSRATLAYIWRELISRRSKPVQFC